MIDDWQFDATRRAKAAQIDTAAPNAARVADFLNEGRNNFEADRRAARVMMASAPAIAEIVPAVLAFHRRAVRFLALEAGIRQFLDVGTGLSGVEISGSTAQAVDPACRVVYVDDDPMTLAHVRAFSRSTPQGAIAALDAKLTDPAALLAGSAATLDFRRPVAVLLPSTLPFIPSTERAAAIVAGLLAALSPGSYLALCHVASDLDPALGAGVESWNKMSSQQFTLRSRAEVAASPRAWTWLSPACCRWTNGATPGGDRPDRPAPVYAVLARKPAQRARRSTTHR